MALVNIESEQRKVVNALRKCMPGQGIEMLSYKRNRGIFVIKADNDEYRLVERGYLQQELHVTEKQLSRQLKSMMNREFPRSRKVRIYRMEDTACLALNRKKL